MNLGPKRGGAFGTVAEFDDPHHIMEAAQKVRDAGYTRTDAFTPFPVHGLTDAIGFKEVTIPWMVAGAGVTGLLSGFALEYWASVYAYPHNIGGRPLFSWVLFVPPAFETTILLSAFAAVFGMLAMNKLPQPYHPVFSAPNFERASQDRFFLLVESRDPAYDRETVTELLRSTGALNVTSISEDEEGWS